MLKELEKLFGFRTSENTNVTTYLNRMDAMGKLDSKKINELMAVFIKKIIDFDELLTKLETRVLVHSENIDKVNIGTTTLIEKVERLEKNISALTEALDALEKAVSEQSSASPDEELEKRVRNLELKDVRRKNAAKARASRKKKS